MAICWDRRVLLSFQKWKRWIQTTGLSDASKLDLLSNHRTLNNHNKTITEITTLIFWPFVETAGYFCHSKIESAEANYRPQWRASKLDLKLQLWYFGNLSLSNHRTLNNHNKTITEITTLIFWQSVETAGYFCHSKNESAEFKLPASVTIRSWIFYLIIELWIIITRQLLKLQLWYFGNLLRPQVTSVIQKMKALNSNYRPQWRFEVGSFI